MGLPWKDGSGWRPDSRAELAADVVMLSLLALSFGFFTGLDAQVQYVATAPGDYIVSSQGDEQALYFTDDSVELMNDVSSRSLGMDAVAAERLYCGEVRDSVVRNFRFADFIEDSTVTSVKGSCESPVDVWVHSQPDGSDELSAEDKDLESDTDYTCIQSSEIAVSPVSDNLNGLKCWNIVDNGEGFNEIPVKLR